MKATTYALARARARTLAREQLQRQITAFLALPETLPERGKAARGRICHDCQRMPRYPDHRCHQHTAYLTGTTTERGQADASDDRYAGLWSGFFGRVFSLRGLMPGPTTLMDVQPGSASRQVCPSASLDKPGNVRSP